MNLLYFAMLKFEIHYIMGNAVEDEGFCRSMKWKQVTKKLMLTLT